MEPIWKVPRPSWLSDARLSHLSILDWSTVPTFLNNSQWLAGTNIAFPRKLLESVGGFEVELGRRGTKLLSMEEALVRQRLEASGFQTFYHPEIVVQHHIPAARLTKRWFIRRVYWQGVSNALVQIFRESPSRVKRFRAATVAALSLLRWPHQIVRLVAPTNDPDRFSAKCATYGRIGYIAGLLGMSGP